MYVRAWDALNNIDVKLIVMVNNRLGMVREVQDKQYGGRHAATLLDGSPDVVKIAQAYGLDAAMAESNAQAKELAAKMLASKKPFVLACRVDPDTPTI